MQLRLLLALSVFLTAPLAAKTLDVVTTSSTGALLVREVAGGHANVTVLAPPDRDMHYLQVRPSMMRALRGADLLIAVGADLEIGWLPVAIRQAANPTIQPGRGAISSSPCTSHWWTSEASPTDRSATSIPG